jgi:hypothetical protein
MMLCDISVVFNSFADAFGLNRANPASNMPAVVDSWANICSTRSASTLMDCQPERLRRPSWARPTPIFILYAAIGVHSGPARPLPSL